MNILLAFFLFFFSVNVHAEVLDRIVAVVEAQDLLDKTVKPKIITQSEVDEMTRPLLLKLRKAGETVDPGKIRKRALEELVLRALTSQKAGQLGITVEQKDIDALMGQVERENRLPFGSLPRVLAQQGIALEQYQRGLKHKLLQSRLISRVIYPMVSVSDEEVRALYDSINKKPKFEEIRLSQILLELDSNPTAIHVERVRHQAQELVDKLRQGHSLETLAGQYSDDSSGLSGGDMGWFKRGELLPQLEEVIFHLNKGAIAGPIRSAQGFHVFKVIDKRAATQVTREKSKIKVRHLLIKVPKKATEEESAEALSQIRGILKQLHQGVPFADLAKQYSQDGTAVDGGDLGWVSEGLMVPSFENAAFSLAIGEVSGPVRTSFGWHLIRVDEKQFLDPSSLEAQRKELTSRVMEAKTKSRYEQWLRDLRQRSFVEFRAGF